MSLRPISCNFRVSLGEFVALLDLCRQFCFICGQLICMHALNSCNEFFVYFPWCMNACNMLISWQCGVVVTRNRGNVVFKSHSLDVFRVLSSDSINAYKTAYLDRFLCLQISFDFLHQNVATVWNFKPVFSLWHKRMPIKHAISFLFPNFTIMTTL